MKTRGLKMHPLLAAFCPVVDCVADLFGPDCEVVLHDITLPERSIVRIRNGHVTGRKVGDSLTDLGLMVMRDPEKGLETIGNYNPRTRSGHLLKSNAVAIKDARGALIGFLCINLDVSSMQGLRDVLQGVGDDLGKFFLVPETSRAAAPREEHFEKDLMPRLWEIIDKTIKGTAKSPDSLSSGDRQEIIGDMDDKGLFLMKNSVHRVADSLGISVPSVYRYLEKARRNRPKTEDGEIY
jgi:predicted transcriptional regulator YheO